MILNIDSYWPRAYGYIDRYEPRAYDYIPYTGTCTGLGPMILVSIHVSSSIQVPFKILPNEAHYENLYQHSEQK